MTPEDENNNRRLRERIRRTFKRFSSNAEAKAAFTWTHSALTNAARSACPNAEILNFGPDVISGDLFDPTRVGVLTGPGDDRWAAIVKVETDADRDRLRDDKTFLETLRRSASEAGFPPYEIDVESQETVDSKFDGSWTLRRKA